MIKIICIGHLKEKYLVDACNEYLKRLGKYGKVELIELEDSTIDNQVVALEKEKVSIEKEISSKDFLVVLDIDGQQLDSVEFSEKLNKIMINNSNITFLIGSSFGISKDIKDRANMRLSFSKMTFPHQLFRVMLLEQLYRCFKIMNNERYHK